MTIHSIADLHLDSGGKPMDVFGASWDDHEDRIFANWRALVKGEDLVLIPGDISWAMQLNEAKRYLDMIGELPGTKLILRGNHDYWWSSLTRVRAALPDGMYALQNDSFAFQGVAIAGTRGWTLPQPDSPPEDIKIYDRELIRLEMSLKDARRRNPDAPLIAMMHYPPLTPDNAVTGFTGLLQSYGAETCVYGHLHGAALRGAARGEFGGIRYIQVSSDGIGFAPVPIYTN